MFTAAYKTRVSQIAASDRSKQKLSDLLTDIASAVMTLWRVSAREVPRERVEDILYFGQYGYSGMQQCAVCFDIPIEPI